MKLVVISAGIIITCLLILFQLAEFSRFTASVSMELVLIAFGIVCLVAGLLLRKKPVIVEKEIIVEKAAPNKFVADEKEIKKLGLSVREIEILQLINRGLSNQQIADELFISENTIKKHVSNLLFKMDVARRTEAIHKAKNLGLLQ